MNYIRPVHQFVIVSVLGACVIAAPSTLQAQVAKVNITEYRVTLNGLDPFNCQQIDGIGIDIDRAPKNSPRPVKARVRNVKLIRRFTPHRELHAWIHQTKRGQVELKNGYVELLDAAKKPIVRFNIYAAWPRSWSMQIPPLGKEGLVAETLVLDIRDLEIVY